MVCSDAFWDLVKDTEKILDELIPLRVVERQQKRVQSYWGLKDMFKEKNEQLKHLRFWQFKEKRKIKERLRIIKIQLQVFFNENDVDKIIEYTLEAKGW